MIKEFLLLDNVKNMLTITTNKNVVNFEAKVVRLLHSSHFASLRVLSLQVLRLLRSSYSYNSRFLRKLEEKNQTYRPTAIGFPLRSAN